MKPLYKRAKFDNGLIAQDLSNSNKTGDYFGLQMYRKAIAVLNVGALTAGTNIKIELLQATDTAGTNSKVIDGANTTITATEAKTSGKAFVEVDVSSLDINNGFEFIAAKVTTTATTQVAVTLICGDGRFEPDNDFDAYAVV